MTDLHDADPQMHKRTSINELLNPVSGASSQALDSQNFSPNHGPVPGHMPPQFPHHPQTLSVMSSPASSFASPMTSTPSFSLRAASWDHNGSRPHEDESCRFSPSGASQSDLRASHGMYAEYGSGRPRMDGSSGYPMSTSEWGVGPVSSQATTISYSSPSIGHPAMPGSPSAASQSGYTDEHPENYPSQHSHDAQRSYNSRTPTPAGYVMDPRMNWQAAQSTERASVRLAARNTSHPQHQMIPLQYPQYFPPGGIALFPYPPQYMQPAQKRSADNDDEESAVPKKKRAVRTKADGTPIAKRGYTAKKRNEAAQIAAQNAQMMTTVSYAQPADRGIQPANGDQQPMRVVADANGPPTRLQTKDSGPLHPELQFARCMSNRYRSETFPRCVSCTRRWAGDTCRFQAIRFFLRDENRNIVGISFVESQKADAPSMSFPSRWNTNLSSSHINKIKRTVARALLPVLREELQHLEIPEIIRRPRESDVRATCDTCMTSIFSSSWMCRLCGREACAECYEQVKELTDDRGAEDADVLELQSRREKHARRNPFFLSCTRRNEHQAKDFSPMSRFCKTELAQAIKDMDALLATPETESVRDEHPPDTPAVPEAPVPETIHNQDDTSKSDDPDEPSVQDLSSDPSVIPYRNIKKYANEELQYDVFRKLWADGEPLMVTGLLSKFQIKWNPEYFVEHYFNQSCLVIECQSDVNKRVTVGEFFQDFGKYEGRRDSWKLKDWPPSTDFKTAFPELYADFSQAVPIPNYVRRDGALNIASHFPSNTVAPDIGPKMYNAMASYDSPGSKGSTRLHMDMADAINVMLYAAQTPDGKPGSAAWDLFRARDSAQIRMFLRKKFKGQFQNDPIHCQLFYLDSVLRKQLLDEYGVKSYRVYQRPGEAIFIPAGCAHQVCNLADCIKIAIDFVSPENIDRCERLTKEFREQNQSMAWKEDVLQLRTMMWFAWLSCSRQEKNKSKSSTGATAAANGAFSSDTTSTTSSTGSSIPLMTSVV